MKHCILIFIALISAAKVAGQANPRSSSYSREVSMDVDNDIFFFVDYYYTAGQNLNYRRLANPNGRLYRRFTGTADSAKVIISYSAGFKIFTPRDIDSAATRTMDRPYAGWSYGKFAITNFSKPSISNRYEIEIGLIGRNSRMGQVQRWVHNQLDFLVPQGWDSQIRNEFVVNFYYSRYKEIAISKKLDLVSLSALTAGTGMNKLSQDFTFRFLRFNPINNSAFTQSRLSWSKPGDPSRKEVFLFFGMGLDYVMSNIFIQGSLFKSRESVFTVPMQPILFRQSAGIMFASKSITWNITAIHLSKEVKQGTDHVYASLGMAVRF